MLLILLSSSSVHSLTPDFSSSISSSFAIISIFLSPSHFSFHCLQFLFNLSQYSWLYLLSDHPNSFLAINLPGNSLLLNIPSLCSRLATSSRSHWYSFSNSLIASCAFFKFSFPSQVSNFTVNLFQYTKYLSFPLTYCLFRILFTFHSSSPLIITGASCFFLCPSTCPTYLCILLTFTTGYTLTVIGNLSQMVTYLFVIGALESWKVQKCKV